MIKLFAINQRSQEDEYEKEEEIAPDAEKNEFLFTEKKANLFKITES